MKKRGEYSKSDAIISIQEHCNDALDQYLPDVDNYISEESIIGMMNSRAHEAQNFYNMYNHLGYYTNAANTKCAIFGKFGDAKRLEELKSRFEEIKCMYIDETDDLVGILKNAKQKFYTSRQIRSVMPMRTAYNLRCPGEYESFMELPAKVSKSVVSEMKNTYSKYIHKMPFLFDKGFKELTNSAPTISITNFRDETLDDILALIEEWRYTMGYHYRFNEHAGIDKAFFKRYAALNEEERKAYNVKLFWSRDSDQDEYKLSAYAVMCSKCVINENGDPEYKYVIRKTRDIRGISSLRNFTEFVDLYMMTHATSMMSFHQPEIYNSSKCVVFNWGCSSGGVLWYKTHKFPLYDIKTKYFFTVKRPKQ